MVITYLQMIISKDYALNTARSLFNQSFCSVSTGFLFQNQRSVPGWKFTQLIFLQCNSLVIVVGNVTNLSNYRVFITKQKLSVGHSEQID